MLLSNPKIDYSSVRRMPSVKQSGQTQGTNANSMPTSTSLQDINSHTHKFNWNKDQRLISLPESLLSAQNGTNAKHKTISQSDDRIFEHPEIIIKPTTHDDKAQRRLLATKSLHTNDIGGGSVPNILEHPDMRTPIVLQNQQIPSSSSSSSDRKRLIRQQSADVYATLARTTSPINRDNNQARLTTNQIRSASPGSLIGDIIESPEQEKSEDTRSPSSSSPPPPPPASKGPTKIIREYSETSSASDVDATGKHSNNHTKPQSEEDDFW